MIISKRTKLSLCQFLTLFNGGNVYVLLQKYDFPRICSCDQIELSVSLSKATESSISNLIEEIIKTRNTLRSEVNPKYRFDERWDDLKKCLMLDGYIIEHNKLLKIEPTIDGVESMDDDLANLLTQSNLCDFEEVINHIKRSTDSFNQSNYNDCLSNARIALETIVRAIALSKNCVVTSESKAWGESLAYLKNRVVTEKEEKTVAHVYSFISDGCHVPIGFTEEEFARFGRNLAMSMCYFLTKKLNVETSIQPNRYF
jgi:hypothetical protein